MIKIGKNSLIEAEFLSAAKKQEIIDTLIQRCNKLSLSFLPCSRCGTSHFTLLDGYFSHIIQVEFNTMNLKNSRMPSIPFVIVVCDNCGHMSSHALGILDSVPSVA